MEQSEWPLGTRFHPTDVELLKLFLKRKVQGKKISFEAIADLDVYKHAPWDLPHMSILNTGDLRWYFFCPSVKKYAKGNRLNRASDFGCWKGTGKDKPIMYRGKKLGTMKSLVFYGGASMDDMVVPVPESMEAPQVADLVQSTSIDNYLMEFPDEAFINNGDQGNCNFGLEQEAPRVHEEDDISSWLASYQVDNNAFDFDFLEQDVTRGSPHGIWQPQTEYNSGDARKSQGLRYGQDNNGDSSSNFI
ncbi:No apical meristem (NAM) protein [Corchorus olitorius]|uniref:No apical meristem (NAM) protein n=1 Tax=Corchorus olitorius TaxID=93759 RepID=A0A1R3I374_9ROSI|nr:No apical meristem (NAM) protein [Corchorus olitorius]